MATATLKPADLRDCLIEQNRYFATSDDLCELLGVRPESLYGSLHRPAERGEMANVCPGGWVPVPGYTEDPWGLPPLTFYLDEMMRHLGHDYYIGHASAAERWGAAHHRPLYKTTVVTTARTAHRTEKDSRFSEASRQSDMLSLVRYLHSRSIKSKQLDVMRGGDQSRLPLGVAVAYSSPEVTLLDMVERTSTHSGVDHAGNTACLLLLWGHLDAGILAEQSLAYPTSTRQRAGFILEAASAHMGIPFDVSMLADSLPRRSGKVRLFAGCDHWFPPIYEVPDVFAVHPTWRVQVNGLLDIDV